MKLLDGLKLPPAADQRFDGRSLLPALRGETFERGPVFQFFPHSPGVPEWMLPAVSVHQGLWKLIRLFHAGKDGAHRHKLFNLADDLGERRDLAATETTRVQELDALIETFLRATKAVTPKPNPAFDATKLDLAAEGIAEPRKAGQVRKPRQTP